jgi:hypothetical protein
VELDPPPTGQDPYVFPPKPLTDCAKNIIREFLVHLTTINSTKFRSFRGLDSAMNNLGLIRVNYGLPDLVQLGGELFSGIDVEAFTWGNDIYFDTDMYHPDTAAGLARIAHEVMHAFQFSALGTVGFLREYGTSYNNPLETEADQFQADFIAWFAAQYQGNSPCAAGSPY